MMPSKSSTISTLNGKEADRRFFQIGCCSRQYNVHASIADTVAAFAVIVDSGDSANDGESNREKMDLLFILPPHTLLQTHKKHAIFSPVCWFVVLIYCCTCTINSPI